MAAIDLSAGRLEELRSRLWFSRDAERDQCLEQIAEVVELMVASRQGRSKIAATLRSSLYSHSEIGLLRNWAIRHKHLELDEMLVAIGAEIRGKRVRH